MYSLDGGQDRLKQWAQPDPIKREDTSEDLILLRQLEHDLPLDEPRLRNESKQLDNPQDGEAREDGEKEEDIRDDDDDDDEGEDHIVSEPEVEGKGLLCQEVEVRRRDEGRRIHEQVSHNGRKDDASAAKGAEIGHHDEGKKKRLAALYEITSRVTKSTKQKLFSGDGRTDSSYLINGRTESNVPLLAAGPLNPNIDSSDAASEDGEEEGRGGGGDGGHGDEDGLKISDGAIPSVKDLILGGSLDVGVKREKNYVDAVKEETPQNAERNSRSSGRRTGGGEEEEDMYYDFDFEDFQIGSDYDEEEVRAMISEARRKRVAAMENHRRKTNPNYVASTSTGNSNDLQQQQEEKAKGQRGNKTEKDWGGSNKEKSDQSGGPAEKKGKHNAIANSLFLTDSETDSERVGADVSLTLGSSKVIVELLWQLSEVEGGNLVCDTITVPFRLRNVIPQRDWKATMDRFSKLTEGRLSQLGFVLGIPIILLWITLAVGLSGEDAFEMSVLLPLVIVCVVELSAICIGLSILSYLQANKFRSLAAEISLEPLYRDNQIEWRVTGYSLNEVSVELLTLES